MKNYTLITLFVGATAFITSAQAEISGNLGVTSDYMWRGVSQNGGATAVSGGLDYTGTSFYAGTWISDASWAAGMDTEVDLYIGTEIGGFDVGVCKYMYPDAQTNDFTEIYVGYTFKGFDLSYAFDEDATSNEFYSIGYGFDIVEGLTGYVTFGAYDFTDTANDYDYLQLDIAYGDLTISLSEVDGDDITYDTDLNYVVSYGWGF